MLVAGLLLRVVMLLRLLVRARRNESRRARVERERRRHLRRLLRGRRFRRVAGERRAFGRRGAVYGHELLEGTPSQCLEFCNGDCVVADRRRGAATVVTHIVVRQQVRAEFHVVLEVEGASGLVLDPKGGEGRRLGQVLHAAHPSELLVRVLRDGQSRRSPVAPAMVTAMGYGRSGD